MSTKPLVELIAEYAPTLSAEQKETILTNKRNTIAELNQKKLDAPSEAAAETIQNAIDFETLYLSELEKAYA